MHKKKQKNPNEMTSFNEPTFDPSDLVELDEIDLEGVTGGKKRCNIVCSRLDVCPKALEG